MVLPFILNVPVRFNTSGRSDVSPPLQALSDLQDIMGDPVVEDCTSLPQLPDDSAKDKREQDSQWCVVSALKTCPVCLCGLMGSLKHLLLCRMPDFEFEAFCQPPSVKIKFESLPSLEQNAADSMMVDALDLNAISCSDASTSCGVWSPGSTQATPEFEFESCAAVAPPIPPQLPSYSVSSISMADALGSQPLQMGSAWPTAEELSRNGQLEAMKNLLQQQIAHHQAVLRQQQQLAQVPPHVPLNLLSMPGIVSLDALPDLQRNHVNKHGCP